SVRNYSSTLQAFWYAIHDLDDARVRQARAMREAGDFLHLIRSAHTLSEVVRAANNRPANQGLPQAARALYDEAQRRIDFANPLRAINPGALDHVQAMAQIVLAYLTAAEGDRTYVEAGRRLKQEFNAIMTSDVADVWKGIVASVTADHIAVATQ